MWTVAYCYLRQTWTHWPDKKGNAGDVSEILIQSTRYQVYSSSDGVVIKQHVSGEDVYSETIYVQLLI